MGGQSLPWGPGLIDITSRLAKRTFTIESASLASDQFTTSIFRHATGAESSIRPVRVGTGRSGAADVHVREGSYSKRQLVRWIRRI